MPLAVGGGIRSLTYIDELFKSGADKVILNNAIFTNPDLISQAVHKYGSQAVVASIDVKRDVNGELVSFIDSGSVDTGISLLTVLNVSLT